MKTPRALGGARIAGAVRLPLLLAILCTGAAALAPRGAAVFDFVYREITPRWADVTRRVIELAPFSLSSVTLLALVLAAIWLAVRGAKRQLAEGSAWLLPWAILRPFVATSLWIYLLALLPWGVLHRRAPIEERRGFVALEPAVVVTRLRRQAEALARSTPPFSGTPSADLERRAAEVGLAAVRRLDPAHEIAACGARDAWPRGALAAIGVNGIFLPGWMEPHVEPSLLPCEKLFAIAHEEAHRGGFTSEAEANLAAYLGLAGASEPELRHAALVALLLHAEAALRDPRYGAPVELPERVIADAEAARQRAREQRWETLARSAARVNDTYLRVSGDRGGARSYGVFPELLARALESGFER